ncbi:hypothetical protein J6590_105124 [Homalodisca vitripennis]|nr:hypothetical protein J6590_105124 [Homalodisca vitripennis]
MPKSRQSVNVCSTLERHTDRTSYTHWLCPQQQTQNKPTKPHKQSTDTKNTQNTTPPTTQTSYIHTSVCVVVNNNNTTHSRDIQTEASYTVYIGQPVHKEPSCRSQDNQLMCVAPSRDIHTETSYTHRLCVVVLEGHTDRDIIYCIHRSTCSQGTLMTKSRQSVNVCSTLEKHTDRHIIYTHIGCVYSSSRDIQTETSYIHTSVVCSRPRGHTDRGIIHTSVVCSRSRGTYRQRHHTHIGCSRPRETHRQTHHIYTHRLCVVVPEGHTDRQGLESRRSGPSN